MSVTASCPGHTLFRFLSCCHSPCRPPNNHGNAHHMVVSGSSWRSKFNLHPWQTWRREWEGNKHNRCPRVHLECYGRVCIGDLSTITNSPGSPGAEDVGTERKKGRWGQGLHGGKPIAIASVPTNHANSLLLLISLDGLREGIMLTHNLLTILTKAKGMEGPGNNRNSTWHLRGASHSSKRLLLF